MQGVWNNKKVTLPDFILPGAAKSGTTTLYRILQQHPGIHVPSYRKETYFFAYFDRDLSYEKSFLEHTIRNPMEYLGIFSESKEDQLIGEASIGYLYDYKESIENMKKFYGENLSKVKIVVILRNPIDRAFSHYTFLIRNGFENLSFEDAIKKNVVEKRMKTRPGFDYLDYGNYAAQIKAFQDNFSEVKVFLFEELKDLGKLSHSMFEFLGVEAIQIKNEIKANPSGIPKNRRLVNFMRKNNSAKFLYRMLPKSSQSRILNFRDKMMASTLKKQKMKVETRNELVEYFRNDITDLSKLINRDLSHWLTKS